MRDIEFVQRAEQAVCLLAHPLRARILAAAQAPISASDLGRQLQQPRQRLNYHVRQLAEAGLLERAARQKKGNMLEQQYVASARSYLLSTDAFAAVSPPRPPDGAATSPAALTALCASAQREVGSLMAAAEEAGLRARAFSLSAAPRFESAEQRTRFMSALRDAVSAVIAAHSSNDGAEFRLVLGCYPAPVAGE